MTSHPCPWSSLHPAPPGRDRPHRVGTRADGKPRNAARGTRRPKRARPVEASDSGAEQAIADLTAQIAALQEGLV